MKKWIRSFVWAWNGIRHAGDQTNLRIQATLFAVAIALSIILKISRMEWLIILATSALVFSLELVNTSIELLSDRITKEHDAEIGRVKDISAGAVLVAAVFALIAGVLIFVPKIT